MATIGSLVVNLVANTAGFSSGLAKGVKESKAFEGRIKAVTGTLKSMAGVLGIAGAGFTAGSFIKGALEEAIEAENVMKQLETVIKSTGGAAGFTAEQISDYAAELQKTTTFADDTTKASAALLATFTNVKGGIFKEAIKSAQDFAVATGTDLESAIQSVGRALNDPTKLKGFKAFSAEIKAQIALLVKQGDTLGAQKLILKELSDLYGGSAAAALDTTSGKIKQLSNDWADLKETIGETIALPVVNWLSRMAKGYGEYYNNTYESVTNRQLALGPTKIEYGIYGGKAKEPMAPSVAAPIAKAIVKQFGVSSDGNGGIGGAIGKAMKKNFVRNTGFSALLSDAFATQYIGKNRASTAFPGAYKDKMKEAEVMRRDSYRPIAGLERGSSEAYSAVLQSKGANFGATLVETSRQQLAVARQQLAALRSQFGTTPPPVPVTIGGA